MAGHGGSVTVKYKVFGDRVDGTYLAVDTTHAHINMPAAIMWAHGLDDRPVTVRFEQPAGMRWQVATQLHPGIVTARVHRAQPAVSDGQPVGVRAGRACVSSPSRLAHLPLRAASHRHRRRSSTATSRTSRRSCAQEGAIYGEYPEYEPGYYTFLADYLPYANGDGMEHRNSTVITAAGSIAVEPRADLLDTVAHEFFHCWNVERIRPKGLEPFDFDRANMSGELWLAEGFTQYYGPLAMQRAGLDGPRRRPRARSAG